MKLKFSQLLPFTILLISVSSVLPWCSLPIDNTFLWWCLRAVILFCFFKMKPKRYSVWQIKIFLFYLCFSALYGAIYMAQNYWDWKLWVDNLTIFALPLAVYVYYDPKLLTKTLKIWLKYAWIVLLVLSLFLSSDAFGRYLVPFSFLILFLPLLNQKYKIIVIAAYLITVTIGADNRSDTVKFTTALLLGVYGYWRYMQYHRGFVKTMYVLLMLSPILFFVLGITGIFNIFRIEEVLGLENKYTMTTSSGDEISVMVDTRTLLYVEEINSALKHGYALQGRSPARGYESVFGKEIDNATGIDRGERVSCEVSILNIFNYFGIMGVCFYFIIFSGAAYKAIFQSENIYLPILGVYVAFRWLFAWIEDFSRFDLNYLFLWIMIGICYSPLYRNMNNMEFKNWINSIINHEYKKSI